jgi:phosphoribosylaminoimidazole-succinocarboxamide synthase
MQDANDRAGSLPRSLEETDFPWLGKRYRGKVRDSYTLGDHRILIATDRLSAFDRSICAIPGKGQVLTQMARYWFERTSHIAENHVIAVPDPSVTVAREVSIIPVEVVVRGYLAGGAWRDYKAGRPISGVLLPPGLKEFEQLPQPIVTPSTKEAVGSHDLPISESELVARGLVAGVVWEQVRATALALFTFASKEVEQRGLLLADTKYEFGLLGESVVLADEIHTLDCSRYWVRETYEQALSVGAAPEMLDKEPIRRWLMQQGFSGEGEVPMVSDEYKGELREYYRVSAERITGQRLSLNDTDPIQRIEANMRRFLSHA